MASSAMRVNRETERGVSARRAVRLTPVPLVPRRLPCPARGVFSIRLVRDSTTPAAAGGGAADWDVAVGIVRVGRLERALLGGHFLVRLGDPGPLAAAAERAVPLARRWGGRPGGRQGAVVLWRGRRA
ncbi:Os01g0796950 [Oryza sativa Japonica Group]|uniref:Os01g0796950 protein n=1 Tax=Oryza sativa subsp. japonica TaxID=39947 RepID=A0A0P0V980_ORYSJ|nr:Os01g0796950 [Oryza sativa Japonica Group]